MSAYGWDQMAEWWDEKIGDEGDLWHRTLIDPPLIRLVDRVKGLRLLDLACGNGYLSRRFARQGAIVIGVDANVPIIERARGREERDPLGVVYHVADASCLDMLEDNSQDLVICNMALMDIENAAGTIQEVARVLRRQGRFIASLSHPCFDKVNTSGWAIERIYPTTTIWRKISRYREVIDDELPWLQIPGEVITTRVYHRPLSWYFRAFRNAGLVIANFEEPEPTEEFLANSPQGAWIAEIPLHCVIEVWKI